MQCPKCSSTDYIKSGIINKKQRYKCEKCSCQFTKSEKPGVPLYIKMQATLLFLSGLSMNKVAEILNVAPPTVMRWINYFKEKLGEDFPKAIKTENKELSHCAEPSNNNRASKELPKKNNKNKDNNRDNNNLVQASLTSDQFTKKLPSKENLEPLLKLSTVNNKYDNLSGCQVIRLDNISYMIITKLPDNNLKNSK